MPITQITTEAPAIHSGIPVSNSLNQHIDPPALSSAVSSENFSCVKFKSPIVKSFETEQKNDTDVLLNVENSEENDGSITILYITHEYNTCNNLEY